MSELASFLTEGRGGLGGVGRKYYIIMCAAPYAIPEKRQEEKA